MLTYFGDFRVCKNINKYFYLKLNFIRNRYKKVNKLIKFMVISNKKTIN